MAENEGSPLSSSSPLLLVIISIVLMGVGFFIFIAETPENPLLWVVLILGVIFVMAMIVIRLQGTRPLGQDVADAVPDTINVKSGGGGGSSTFLIIALILVAVFVGWRMGWFGDDPGSFFGLPKGGILNSLLGNTQTSDGSYSWGFDLRPSVLGALALGAIGVFVPGGFVTTAAMAAVGFSLPAGNQFLGDIVLPSLPFVTDLFLQILTLVQGLVIATGVVF